MMIAIISLWAECTNAVTGDRKLLTSKLFLLIFIRKKVQGTGKTDIRLSQSNNRFCSKLKLKERVQVVIFIWQTQKNKYCGYPHANDQTPHSSF